MRLLVSYGADINARTTDGSTPIVWAAARDDVAMVHALLALGANPNVHSRRKGSPIEISMYRHNPQMLRSLLASSPHQPSISIFHLACSESYHIARVLLDDPRWGAAASSFPTLLHHCIQHRQLDILRLLLARGLPVDSPDPMLGETPLDLAARLDCRPALLLLLRSGASITRLSIAASCPDRHHLTHILRSRSSSTLDLSLSFSRFLPDEYQQFLFEDAFSRFFSIFPSLDLSSYSFSSSSLLRRVSVSQFARASDRLHRSFCSSSWSSSVGVIHNPLNIPIMQYISSDINVFCSFE